MLRIRLLLATAILLSFFVPASPVVGTPMVASVSSDVDSTAKLSSPLVSSPTSILLAPSFAQLVGRVGETFYTNQFQVPYQSGPVILSGDPAPTGSFSVDDAMVLTVTRPDGSVVTWSHVFEVGCYAIYPSGPVDITSLFRAGVNTVSIRLYDVCGGWEGNWPIFLTYTPATADLSITKSASPNPALVGQNLTYTINVQNNGPLAATGVTLSDALPASTAFISKTNPLGWSCITPPVGGSGMFLCTTDSLASGGSAVFTIGVRVTASPGTSLPNTATVSANEPDPNTANNTATTSTMVAARGVACDSAPGNAELASAFQFPLDAGFSRYFAFKDPYPSNFRVVSWRGTYHPGVDYHLSLNAKTYAVANGVVFRKNVDQTGYGNYAVIEHLLPAEWGGGKVYSVYAHLRDYQPAPAIGCPVEKGQLIGVEGASGEGAGGIVHLHFELRKPSGIDPWNTFPYPVGGTDPAHNIDNFLDPDSFIPTHTQ